MKSKIITKAIKPFFHFFTLLLAFWVSYQLRLIFPNIPIPPINYNELLYFAIYSGVLWVVIWYIFGLFSLTKITLWYYSRFMKALATRFVIITFLAYFGNWYIFIYGISRFIIISSGFVVWGLLSIVDSIWAYIYRQIFKAPETILLISNIDTNNADFASDLPNNLQAFGNYEIHSDMYSTMDYIYHIKDHDVVMLVWDLPKDELQDLADKVNIAGKIFIHIPEWLLLDDMIFTPQRFWPILGLVYKSSNIEDRARVAKRLIDIIWSFLGIILFSPIMLVIYILVVLSDWFPAIYTQTRIGKNEKPFKFIKFRTMKKQFCTGDKYGGQKAEEYYQELIVSQNIRPWSILPKIGDDPRVTRIGKFLRKTSLDELPSLFCVLWGSMSLVGPRPHLPTEVDNYNTRQKKLLSVKPGITWYAQIWWRDKIDFNDEANFDLYYIRNWSIRFDIYIILATMKVVTKGN